jgi:hypothetical protein
MRETTTNGILAANGFSSMTEPGISKFRTAHTLFRLPFARFAEQH